MDRNAAQMRRERDSLLPHDRCAAHYYDFALATPLVPAGFFMMSEMASSHTLIQSLTPDAMRDRVMSIYAMMFMGKAPIGALLAGAQATRIGAPATVAGGGAICLVGSVLFARHLPNLRAEARQMIVELQMTAGDPPEEPT